MKIKKKTQQSKVTVTYFVFYKSNFAQTPISQENVNVFCSDLITMVPKWNYFIFMQIEYPRWPPGTVTKNSINTKMTISLEPLVEITVFVPECFLYESVVFFCSLGFQDGCCY